MPMNHLARQCYPMSPILWNKNLDRASVSETIDSQVSGLPTFSRGFRLRESWSRIGENVFDRRMDEESWPIDYTGG